MLLYLHKEKANKTSIEQDLEMQIKLLQEVLNNKDNIIKQLETEKVKP